MRRRLSTVILVAIVASASTAYAQTASGEAVYQKYCAARHEQVTARIPQGQALQKMSSARIMRTLDFGLMMSIAYPLKRDERQAVASFLGTKGGDAPPPARAFCAAGKPPMSAAATGNWTGWSPDRKSVVEGKSVDLGG